MRNGPEMSDDGFLTLLNTTAGSYHWIAECSLETMRASFQAWFRSWSRTDGRPRLPLARQKVYNGKISVGAYVEEAARPHLQWRNGKGTA